MSLRTIKQAGVIAAALVAAASLMATASQAAQILTVARNHTMRVALSAPAGSVIVGNPDIADVSIIDSRTIFIIGKGYGNSAVTITDRNGRMIFDSEIAVTADSRGIVNVYKGLKPSLMICSNICMSTDMSPNNFDAARADSNATPAAGAMANIAPTAGQGAAAVGSVMGAAGR